MKRRDFVLKASAALSLAATGLPRIARAVPSGSAPRNLILVLNAGGWDVTWALDPKPGLPTIDVGPGAIHDFGNIPIWSNPTRPSVDAFFSAYSGVTAVVNGVRVRGIAHAACRKRMLTGTASETNPDLAAIASFELGKDLPVPYLVLGDTAFTGPLAASAGRVGSTNQIVTLLDPADAYPPPAGAGYAQPGFVPDVTDEAAIRALVTANAEREKALRGSTGYNAARIADFEASLDRGDLLKSYRPQMGQRGKTVALAAQMALAVNAIQNGIAWSVMVDSRLGWDTHQTNSQQDGDWEAAFAGIKTLADLLATTPGKQAGNKLIDETIVVVMSEMSRTPKLNAAQGKDHWPVTSAMVFGAGVAGNRVYGGTDDNLGGVFTNLATGLPDPNGPQIQTENLVAGVLELCGVSASSWLPNSEPLRGFIS